MSYIPDDDPVAGQDGRGLFLGLATKDGHFKFKRQSDPAPIATRKIAGVFEHVACRWDEGNPGRRVAARWECHITLSNARVTVGPEGQEQKISLGTVELQVGAPVSLRSAVEKLQMIRSGDGIFVESSLSSRDEGGDTVCFLNFHKAVGGAWKPVRYEELPFKCTGSPEDKYKQSLELLAKHPDFVDANGEKPNDIPRDDPNPGNTVPNPPPTSSSTGNPSMPGTVPTSPTEPAGQPSNPPTSSDPIAPNPSSPSSAAPPAGFTGSAEGGANPSDQKAAQNAASVAAQAPVTPAVQKLKAFGFELPRTPSDAQWNTPAVEGQVTVVVAKMGAAGVTGFELRSGTAPILEELGMSAWDAGSGAAAQILYDFLSNAPQDAIAAWKLKVDPFANE